MGKLGQQQQIVFFRTLFRASPVGAGLWFGLLVIGGALPAVFAVASGQVVDLSLIHI